MRVLHLIDPASPGAGACTLRLLADVTERLQSVQHDVLVLGAQRHVELAMRCGITSPWHMGVSAAAPSAAVRPLRRLISQHERGGSRFKLIHAWTARATRLAIRAAPQRRRLATFCVGPVSSYETQSLMRDMRHHPTTVLTSSLAVQQEYRTLGLHGAAFGTLPLGVREESVEFDSRRERRAAWKVDKDAFVIGLFSEPANWADALIGVEVIARLALSGRRFKLLMHHAAHRRAAAVRRYADLFDDDLIIVDDDVAEPWTVVHGVDAAMLIGGELNAMDLSDMARPLAFVFGGGRRLRPMPGVLPLLWAMAAGLPVVVEAGAAVRDVVEDARSGLLIHPGDINAACDRFLRLHDEPTLAHRVGAAARMRVRKAFHISAYCARLKRAYDQVQAGKPVCIAPDSSTTS